MEGELQLAESCTEGSVALSCVFLLLGGSTFAPSETVVLAAVFNISSIGRTPVDGGAFGAGDRVVEFGICGDLSCMDSVADERVDEPTVESRLRKQHTQKAISAP